MTREKIIWLSQKAYSLCIICMGIQQLAQGEISDNFFPSAFSANPVYPMASYLWGILFTLSGISMLFNVRAFESALISAGAFLLLFIVGQVPFMLFVSEHGNSLLYWAPAMESLAFTGASLVFAASCRQHAESHPGVIRWLSKLLPYAGAFFSSMLIVFGLDHLVYAGLVATMVPKWIPGSYFWTYFTGTALIAAGIAITLRIKLKWAASLLGMMIFIWFVTIHIPRAIDNPFVAKGLELSRVFVSFGFSGIAFLFAFTNLRKPEVA